MLSRRSRTTLAVAVERQSRYVRLKTMPARESAWFRRTLIHFLRHLPAHKRRTLTYDNGSENVQHERVNAVLGTRSYFCAPFHSWERGTVENTVGLVRRLWPKGTDLATLTAREVKQAESGLNRRPRKCLGFRTPAEVLARGVALAG